VVFSAGPKKLAYLRFKRKEDRRSTTQKEGKADFNAQRGKRERTGTHLSRDG